MANRILIKRSTAPAGIPTTAALSLGELALNTYDGRLFAKQNNGSDSIVDLTRNDPIRVLGDATSTYAYDQSTYTSNVTVTLADTAVAAGTYGNVSNGVVNVPRFTVDSKGRVTGVTTESFSAAANLGTISTQNANNVSITGGAIDGTVIGATTAAAGSFTDVSTSGNVTVGGKLFSNDITATNISVDGAVTVTGNLTVLGTTTTVNSTTVAVSDKNIELSKDAANAAQADGAGITVTGPAIPATITYASGDNSWNVNKKLNTQNINTAGTITASGAITGDSFNGTVYPTGNSSTDGGIVFPGLTNDIGGDSATIRYYAAPSSSENGVLELKVTNDDGTGAVGPDIIRLNASGGTVVNNSLTAGSIGTTGTLSAGATTLGSLGVTNNATVGGTLGVTGAATLSSTLAVTSGATVGGALGVTGAATVGGTLGVTGATTLSSTLAVTSGATVGGALGVTGATTMTTLDATSGTFSSTLGVTGATTLSDTLAVASGATVGGALGVTGAATLGSTLGVAGNVAVNTNKFTVNSTSGNVYVDGTLTVNEAITVKDLTITGTTSMAGISSTAVSATQVVYGGTGGAFKGESTFTYAESTNTLSIGNLTLAENATIGGTFGVSGASTLASLGVTNNAAVGGTFGVTGATTLTTLGATSGTFSSTLGVAGDLTINTDKFVVAASSGDTAVKGNFAVNANKFVVTATSGDTSIAGKLSTGGNVTLTSSAVYNVADYTTGALTLVGDASIAGKAQIQGTLRVAGAIFKGGFEVINTEDTIDGGTF